MPKWTEEQLAAIKANNCTILVSAAAGSGKTAVLVERIISLLKQGYQLNRMLIVTFTKAAASEMRERLHRRLLKESRADPEQMGQALDDLESCEISTIHSFCTRVLRNEFHAVGIDPMFRICEENDRKALFEAAYRDVLNHLLEEQDAVYHFVSAFGQKKVREIVETTYTFLMSMPDPFAWLEEKVHFMQKQPYTDQLWYRVLVADAKRQILGMGDLLSAQDQLFHVEHAVDLLRETWQADFDAYQILLQRSQESTQAFYEALASFGFVRAVTCRGLSPEQKDWQKKYQDLRKQMKDLISKITGQLSIDEAKLGSEMEMISSHVAGLYEIIQCLHQTFLEKKMQANYLDFSDLEQLTYEILKQDQMMQHLQDSYDHIFVDECQDVSAIQDAILQSIHGETNHLFMVGDVKQSIYRFRLADPTRFLGRVKSFSDQSNANERRIFLQKNFRSCNTVIDATNRVFRHLMRESVTELDYLPEDELIRGREATDDAPIEVHVIDQDNVDDSETLSSLEAEVSIVIERIRDLLNMSFQDNGVTRNYTYRDMVILLPKVAGIGSKLVEILTSQGVPVYFDGADNYFDLPEIAAIRSLLSVIDNPMQDSSLMAALKMSPFCMNDKDLADIRLCKTGRNVSFYDALLACGELNSELGKRSKDVLHQLSDWHFQCESMRLSDFLWLVLRESGFYSACAALPKGELRQANLRLLCQRAEEYEANGGHTLSEFLQRSEQQRLTDDSRSAKMLGENENLVRIMTMHKSKGLEFPVVFCLQLGNSLHRVQTQEVNLHSKLGISIPYIHRALNIRRRTVVDAAFSVQRLLDEKAERARLLYVAMTRARERLILIGCTPKSSHSTWTLPENDYRVYRAKSMMDWIMQSILTDDPDAFYPDRHDQSMPWRVSLWENIQFKQIDAEDQFKNTESMVNTILTGEQSSMWVQWGKEIPCPVRPRKTSVSSLAKKGMTKSVLPLTDEDESIETKRQEDAMLNPLRLSEIPSKPVFLTEKRMSGAEKGTLIHRVLSTISLKQLSSVGNSEFRKVILSEINEMLEHGQLTKEEMKAIPIESIEQFYKSDIGQRILCSPYVRREWSFNLRFSEDGTLLQGVIDCAFKENDAWIVLDYKTDRITNEIQFVERYTQQVHWYARALEQLTNEPVSEIWLYALSKGKAYAVEKG